MYQPKINVDNRNLSLKRKVKRFKINKKLNKQRKRITCGVCNRVIKWNKYEKWGIYAESQKCNCNKKFCIHFF